MPVSHALRAIFMVRHWRLLQGKFLLTTPPGRPPRGHHTFPMVDFSILFWLGVAGLIAGHGNISLKQQLSIHVAYSITRISLRNDFSLYVEDPGLGCTDFVLAFGP